jgi:formylglycine-generating enzyme required for sulfatase activity
MGTADVAPPVHAVQISRGFWIGKYEVIQAEYEALLGKNPSTYGGARNPVETVSWSDAVAFCTRLTEREQRAGRLPEGYEYRLPTEAEWEYAARGGAKSQANAAGSGQDFAYSGSNHVDEVAWYCGNSGDRRLEDWEKDEKKRQRSMSSNRCRAHPVGQKAPNELGLYDMSGNVWEHCLDWYDESFYDRSPAVDPVNVQAATGRVFRGGSWGNDPGFLHSTGRNWRVPDYAGDLLGFRACLGPEVGF